MSTRLSMGSSPPGESDGNELSDLARGKLPDEEAQIGGEPGSSVQTDIHLRNNSDDSEPSSGMNADECDRLWEDLKAETGYASYFACLEAYEEIHPLSCFLKKALRGIIVDTAPSDYYGCAIVDLRDEGSTSCKLTLRCHSTSGTKILAALRQPPAATRLGILLWDSTSLAGEILDALGLGLRLQSHFFNAFLARHPKTPAVIDIHTGWKILDDVVVVGPYVMTLVRDYLPANPDATPILLIAGVDQKYLQIHRDFQGTFPFHKLATQATRKMTNPLDALPEWMRDYVRRLEFEIKRGRGVGWNDMDLTFSPLTALLQFNIPLFRLECRAARAHYLHASKPRRTGTVENSELKDVFKRRYSLRRMIEDSEDNSLRLRDYKHSQTRHGTPQSQSLMTLEGDLQQIRLEATRLEVEIRDYLQLHTGQLALEESKKSLEESKKSLEASKKSLVESKKSIELSNLQIEEGKRVKIFTILAFVYIPLNLATSIFGMNIEQLNGSGQHLSVFITTAVITLAVTGGSWFMIEQVNSYCKWRKRRFDAPYNGKTQFALVVRLALLMYLLTNGCSQWMWKSRAWWRILMNDTSLLRDSANYREDNGRLNAGEYVSKYGKRGINSWSYFNQDPVIQWVDEKDD